MATFHPPPHFCVVLSSETIHDHITDIQDSQGLIWSNEQSRSLDLLENAKPSTVCIRETQTEETRPDLRDSLTIRHQFVLEPWYDDQLPLFFEKGRFIIGKGSKHFYLPGQFVKEHLDTRLDDLEGLPHVMTLIVTNHLEQLRVCGQQVSRERRAAVVFSLDCPHEVLPSDTLRESFVFPVYGRFVGYRPIRTEPNLECEFDDGDIDAIDRSTFRSVHDEILEKLDDFDPVSSSYEEVRGWLKFLNNPKAQPLLRLLKVLSGRDEWFDSETPVQFPDDFRLVTTVCVEHLDEHGQLQKTVLESGRKEIQVTAPQTITVTTSSPQDSIMAQLRAIVVEERDKLMAAYESRLKRSLVSVEPIPDSVSIPKFPFVVALEGRYFRDSSTAQLIPFDRAVLNFLRAMRQADVFMGVTKPPNEMITYRWNRGSFIRTSASNKFDSLHISSAHVEFDDEHSYDPKYSAIRAYIVVQAAPLQ